MATSILFIQPVNSFLHSTFGYSLSKQGVFKEKSERQYRSVIVTLFGNKKTMCLTFPTDTRITIFNVKQVIYKRLLLEPKLQYIYTTFLTYNCDFWYRNKTESLRNLILMQKTISLPRYNIEANSILSRVDMRDYLFEIIDFLDRVLPF